MLAQWKARQIRSGCALWLEFWSIRRRKVHSFHPKFHICSHYGKHPAVYLASLEIKPEVPMQSTSFPSRILCLAILAASLLLAGVNAGATPIQIYGAWHCSNDQCTWGTVRNITDFDTRNHWLIDRGDGVPSVNLVVLAFVD